MPITDPTIRSWIDEFEEDTGIQITVEYVNGKLVLRTNEQLDIFVLGVPVWRSIGTLIKEMVVPGYPVGNVPKKSPSASWLLVLVDVGFTAVNWYNWLRDTWDYYPDYDRAYGHKKYGGNYWRLDD